MTFRRNLSTVALLIALPCSFALADAKDDLAAGRAALTQGELDKALPLLRSAAEALPESVEAQLALAECHLQSGRLDDAVKQYQAVLKLSPNHARAKAMVDALSGQRTTVEQKLAAAAELAKIKAHAVAAEVARSVLREPMEPAKREQVRLIVDEYLLQAGSSAMALTEATLLAGESQAPAVKATASIIAALAAIELQQLDQARALLKQTDAAPKEWLDRRAVVLLLIELEDDGKAADISAKAGAALAAVPDSPLRQRLIHRLAAALIERSRQRLAAGDQAAALAILWPMLSAAKLPGEDAILKEIKLTAPGGGWLGADQAVTPLWSGAIDTLISVAAADVQRLASRATLLPAWLAAEAARQMPGNDLNRHDRALHLIEQLAALSRPAPDRKAGAVLSRADEMQHALLLALAPKLLRDDHRDRLANAVTAHIGRYAAAQDVAAGLEQFVTPAVIAAAPAAADKPAAVRVALPAGAAAHQRLWQHLIAAYESQGKAQFDKAAATLDAKANETLTPGDRTALSLAVQLASMYPADAKVAVAVEAIPNRYADADKWEAAQQAVRLAHAGLADPATGQLAMIRLQIRRTLAEEGKLLVAGRKLPAALDERIAKALADAAAILRATPRQSHRQTATGFAEPLIQRYMGLQRFDLADAVIAALAAQPAQPADAKVDPLADLRDWALWTRAVLAQRRGDLAVALAAREGDASKLPLHEQHKAALALHGQLITGFAQSPYAPAAVEQMVKIAASYKAHRAFDTAAAVFADFIKAHPALRVSQRMEFELALVSLHKAQRAFDDRTDKQTPPAKLSAEFDAAITALSAFLKAHPAGELAPQTEQQLLSIVRLYGSVDAWPVAREALARLIAAGPPANERRSPGYLRLLEAATYLGELDRVYGLSLLSPDSPAGGDVERATALAWLSAGYDDGSVGGSPPGAKSSTTLFAEEKQAEFADAAKALAAGDRPALTPPANQPAAGTPAPSTATRPRSESDTALAMIRQSEQQHLAQIARLNGRGPAQGEQAQAPGKPAGVALPNGAVLSEAAMKRQDEAAEKAYAILLDLIKGADPAHRAIADRARVHLFWTFGFFERQMRPDRALAMIQRYLTDRPSDPDRITLAFRALTDRVAFASQLTGSERLTQAWADERHGRFEKARADIVAFIKVNAERIDWVNQARVLAFETYLRESELLTPVSPVRAAGLLVRASDELLMLLATVPEHPDCGNFPQRMWNIADRLVNLQQGEQAIYILNRITAVFPTHDLAKQAVLRIAQTYAADLASPLRAVETYQEYLSLNGDTQPVRDQIFAIGSQLATKRRYVEALHVFGVFVDSFPTDVKAAAALQAIGGIHQANEAWTEAVAAYDRIISEYSAAAIVPQVKLAVAECHINLSQWLAARRIYEEVVAATPDAQGGVAKARIDILKNLDRYQKLLDDKAVDRNKDDAQFQIGRIVLDQLQYTDKAIREFRKVVKDFPKSHLADDAQYEIGVALLRVARLDEARQELLKVVAGYPNSPLSDNALHLVGQSFEQEAQRLMGVTVQVARAEAFERGQRAAYQKVQSQLDQQSRDFDEIRKELKKDGKSRELSLNEAYANFRFNDANASGISILNRDAECQAEAESAMEVANRQDRINEAFRQAVAMYSKSAADYPLGDKTSESLLRMAEIYEAQLKDKANAMATYQKVVKFFPGTPVAEDAAWKVAQFHEQQTQYDQAVQAYRDFIRNYPASKRVGDAQFALAESLEQLGRWVEAMDAYETFREKFAKHPKATQAQEQINWIKAYRK